MKPPVSITFHAGHPRVRRGFAMPLVVMLALAGTLLLAVMLDRQSGRTLELAREIETTRSFHFQRGLREIFQAWVKEHSRGAGRQTPLRHAIELDGRVGEITLADGTRITMYAFEVQGTVRTDMTGLTQAERDDAKALLEAVGPLPVADRSSRTRSFGPIPVSIHTAPIETLSDIVNHVTGGVNSSEVLEAILALRDEPNPSPAGLSKPEILRLLDDDHTEAFLRLLTASPRLWEVVLDAELGPQFSPVPTRARYWGLLLLPDPRQSASVYANRINVLTWNQVDLGRAGDPRPIEHWRRARDAGLE